MRLVLIDDSPEALARRGLTASALESMVQHIGSVQWRGLERRLADDQNGAADDAAKSLIGEIRQYANHRDSLSVVAKNFAQIEREIKTGGRDFSGREHIAAAEVA